MADTDLLYRLVANGCQIDVFDERIVVMRISRQASDLSDEVAKLAELRTRGALTEDEFTAAKRRLIGLTHG